MQPAVQLGQPEVHAASSGPAMGGTRRQCMRRFASII